jgi:peptidyl-tRNA hydrolase
MSARSFENYIIEKLGERNQQNDYLANFKETAEWINDTKGDIDALKNYPYPLAEESPIVNEKFQQFFETIKEDENSKLFKDAEAQYRIESGKNIVEAIKDFNGSPRAVVAITHEIMHPTVVAIIDGAKEGNEVGLKHTQTIVDEFNKANPKNQVTVEQLIEGNDAFKDGTTSKKYRAVQEFIAKSWEKYHLEGKQGFSKAFQDVLDQITKAFQSVYKSLSGKQLTPELRKMFDEILGKETTQAQETETQDEVQSFADEIAEETDDEAKNRRINEIAAEYLDAQGTAKYTPKQQAIYDIGLGTNAESFAEFGDRNLITIGLARAYFSKKGMGIDEIALYASNDSGLDITPDDVVDFMLEYPNGLNSRSPRAYDLAMEYKDLTGKNLTTTVAKSILKKAAKGEKVSGGAQKLIEDSYGAFRMTGIVNENNELDLDKLAEIIDDEGYFTQFPLGLTKDEYEKLKEHVKANVLRNEGESLPKLDGEVEAITQEPATEEVAILEVFDTIENAQRTKKTVKGKKEAMEEAVKEYGEVGEKAIFVESNFKDIIESLKEVKDAKGNNILKVKC